MKSNGFTRSANGRLGIETHLGAPNVQPKISLESDLIDVLEVINWYPALKEDKGDKMLSPAEQRMILMMTKKLTKLHQEGVYTLGALKRLIESKNCWGYDYIGPKTISMFYDKLAKYSIAPFNAISR